MATEGVSEAARLGVGADLGELDSALETLDGALRGLGPAVEEGLGPLDEKLKSSERAALQFTDAEKRLTAEIIGAREATKAKAQALGLTTSELKKLEEVLDEAAESADEETAALRRSARQMREASAEAGRLENDLRGAADGGGAFESVFRGLSDFLDVAGVDSARNYTDALADVGGGVEALIKGGRELGPAMLSTAGVFGVLGAAVAAGATGYAVYKNRQSEAQEGAQTLDTVHANLTDTLRTTAGAVRGLTQDWQRFQEIGQGVEDQLDIINGELTQADVNARKQSEAATEAANKNILAVGRRIAALERQIELDEAQIATLETTDKGYERLRRRLFENSGALNRSRFELGRQKEALEGVLGNIQTVAEYQRTSAEVADQEASARRRAAAGTQAEADQKARLLAIEQELARLQGREENRQERFFAAEQDLRAQAQAQEDFVRGLTESRLEGIEAIDAAERQALRSLEELRSQQRAVEGLTRSAVLDIERRASEDQARIQAEFHQRRLEQLDEEAAAVEKLAETERLAKERAAAAELATRRRQVETLGAESLAALDALLENQAAKEGANVERIFRIKQSLGVSEIAIETAKNIAESYPNPALIAGALAVGALQTAAVLGAPKPETRHTGGTITPDTGWPMAGGAPDERIVTVKVGEEVSEGRRQQPVIVVTPPRSRHKDEAFLRAYQTPSTRTRRVVRRGYRRGHARRR